MRSLALIAVLALVAVVSLIAAIVRIVIVIVVGVIALLLLGGCLCCLSGGDDPVIVFGVLEVVLRHHAVAGTLSIPRQRGVFLGDLLRGTPDLHIRPVALIAAGQRVRALAVVVVIAAAAHAPVLLLWPHPILFC